MNLGRVPLIALLMLGTSVPAPASPGGVRSVVLLWNDRATGADSLDQLALETTARSMGLPTLRISPAGLVAARLDSTTLLISPHATAAFLARAEIDNIKERLRSGLRLITDGKSPLSRSLGIMLGKAERTGKIRDRLRPGLFLSWPDSPRVPWISRAPASGAKAIYFDRATGHPLAIVIQIERGRCLYLAPLFDPRSGRGYARFPTLPDAIAKVLDCYPMMSRRAAESYFDPGYRFDQSPDSLAALWKRRGIRTIHAAAWYAYSDPPYDYKKLVDACHRKAILVYAWLEWPYVGRGFWNNHPEWRQKNALLKDAHFDFLYLMDLRNPACMESALSDLDSLLTLEWDGVDVAEFTLTGGSADALEGPVRPEWFTGFTDYCRAEFRREEGFDPVELFDRRSTRYWRTNRPALDAFYRYRARVNVSTQHTLFTGLDRINREHKKSWELMLTIIDNSVHPEFDNLLGFNTQGAVDLLKEFDVTLQIEDPLSEWTRPPQRYAAVGEYYRRLLGERPFLLDVNIVPMKRERKWKFAAAQAVGTEVLQCCISATMYSDRICLYCESTVAEEDWALIPSAMAAGAHAVPDSGFWTVSAPSTLMFRIPSGAFTPLVDDRPWYAYDDSGVIIPAGSHTLRLLRQPVPDTSLRLVSLTGELSSFRGDRTTCTVEYFSRPRCALSFNQQPTTILLDGKRESPPTVNDGTITTILAPPGRHTIVISTE